MNIDLTEIRKLESDRFAPVEELASLIHDKGKPGAKPMTDDEREARIRDITANLNRINEDIWRLRGAP